MLKEQKIFNKNVLYCIVHGQIVVYMLNKDVQWEYWCEEWDVFTAVVSACKPS